MTERVGPGKRSAYKVFRTIGTRWSDNDTYGHMNNVVHYSVFDTAVNGFLIENGVLDLSRSAEIFLVVETGCRYFAEMTFPDVITAGIRVSKLGNSSVRYEIGLFRNDDEVAAAEGFFIHVNVNRDTRRPVQFGDAARRVLEPCLAEPRAD
ncbi:acyl-CoA thioesterase [Ensifer sp. B1-9]|uniref:acyl-CoA thioesterase n=1 Tax=Ensifer sp. B1-9 TaxID=3141455 RepID=UPI003D1A662E